MHNQLVLLLKRKVPYPIDLDYDEILSRYSTYYTNLNTNLKKRFRLRLYQLLHVMEFTSAYFPRITREMRVVIGCAIIEITFGLKSFLPNRFKTVVLLPRQYMYPGFGQPFLGHIDRKKDAIYFSWEDVKNGYLIPDDAVNVALHEMAHVLEFENGFFRIFNRFFDRVTWEEWTDHAYHKMEIIRQDQHDFLKSYGGINMTEMFAVCIETFFEQSEDFKRNLPVLYKSLVELLNQDPINKSNPIIQ